MTHEALLHTCIGSCLIQQPTIGMSERVPPKPLYADALTGGLEM